MNAARRVALASAIGTTIEWYDFFIYGTAAAVVFGPQFFPQVSEAAGRLAAFATFGLGFVARPLGVRYSGASLSLTLAPIARISRRSDRRH